MYNNNNIYHYYSPWLLNYFASWAFHLFDIHFFFMNLQNRTSNLCSFLFEKATYPFKEKKTKHLFKNAIFEISYNFVINVIL